MGSQHGSPMIRTENAVQRCFDKLDMAKPNETHTIAAQISIPQTKYC